MTARTKAAGKTAAKPAKSPKTDFAPTADEAAVATAPPPQAPVDAALWNLAERLIATPEPHPPATQEAPAPRATFPRPQQAQPQHAAPPAPGAPGTMPSASRVRLVRLPNGQTVAVPFNPQTGMPELSPANLAALQQAAAQPALQAAQQRAASLAPPPAQQQPQPQAHAPAAMFDHAAPPQMPAPVRPFTLTPPPPAPVQQNPGGFSMLSQSFQGERPAQDSAPPPAPRFAAEQPAPAPGKASFSILRSRTEDPPRPAPAPAPEPAVRPRALAETLPSAAPSAAPADDDDEWDDADRPGISILGWLGVAVAVAGAAVVACVFQGWI